MAGLAKTMTSGRQRRPPGRWEDAQVVAWGPERTDERREISVVLSMSWPRALCLRRSRRLSCAAGCLALCGQYLGQAAAVVAIFPPGKGSQRAARMFDLGIRRMELHSHRCSPWGQARGESNRPWTPQAHRVLFQRFAPVARATCAGCLPRRGFLGIVCHLLVLGAIELWCCWPRPRPFSKLDLVFL